MEMTKKLARGLKEISPIFSQSPDETVKRPSLELQILSISSPEYDGDSFFLNTYFASQIATPHKPCSLVTLFPRSLKPSTSVKKDPESFGLNLERHWLYWDELRDLLMTPPAVADPYALQSRDIFLDFEYRHLIYCEQTIGLLDKWILLLKPTIESITESYKMIKAGIALNPYLEFFVTFEGKPTGDQGTGFFERFSEVVFKNLGIHLGWLGWLDLSDPDRHFTAVLNAEQLLFQPRSIKPLLGKFALTQWIESVPRQVHEAALMGVAR